MATELAKAYVQIIPSADGIKGSLTSLLADEAESAGAEAGADYSSGFGDKLKSGLATAAKAGLAAITACTAAVVAFAKESISTGMEFDSAMSQVAATMGKTVDEIQELRDYAVEMGSTTSFTATEAAEGLNILAMAGLDADEQMASLADVLNLAAAGSLSLESAASYTVGTIKGFGDSVENASYYTDLIAKGATLSNTSVEALGESLSGCAASASSYGQEAESVTVSLLRLAEQNITGTEATTALNRAMADLYTPTDAAKSALAELGVAAYDAEGNARDFNDVIDELDAALAGYTQEEANAYKSTIFTTEGLSAFNKMTASSAETVDGFAEALSKASGSAADQAATQLDNLSGDITIFQSALDGAKIALSDELTPALRDFVQFGTDAVSTLTTAFQEGGLSGLFSALGTVLSDALAMIMDMLPEVVEAGAQLLTSLVSGILDNLPTVLTAAGEILANLVNGIADGLPRLVDSGGEIVGTLVDTLGSLVPTLLDAGLNLLGAIVEAVPTVVQKLVAALPDLVSNVVAYLRDSLPDILHAAVDMLSGLVQAIPQVVESLVQSLPDILSSIISFCWGAAPEVLAAAVELLWNIITAIPDIVAGLEEAIPDIIQGIVNGLIDGVTQVFNAAKELGSNILGGIKSFLGINSPSTVMEEQGGYIVDGLVEGIADLPTKFADTLAGALSNITAWGADSVKQAAQVAANFLSNLVSGIATLPGKIASTLSSALNQVKTWASSIVKQAQSTAASFLGGLVNGISDLPKQVLSTLTAVASNVTSWGSSLTSSFKTIGKNVISGLINGITGMVSSLYSSIKNALSGLVSKAKSALGIGSPSKVFRTEIGEMIGEGLALGIDDSVGVVDQAMEELLDTTQADAAVIPVAVAAASDVQGANIGSGVAETSPVAVLEQLAQDFDRFFAAWPDFLDSLEQIQVVTDTGVLVGEMVVPMDRALGRLSVKKARQL